MMAKVKDFLEERWFTIVYAATMVASFVGGLWIYKKVMVSAIREALRK